MKELPTLFFGAGSFLFSSTQRHKDTKFYEQKSTQISQKYFCQIVEDFRLSISPFMNFAHEFRPHSA